MTRVIGSYDDRDVSLLAQDQYFRQVHWTPRLTQEEQAALLERVQRGREASGQFSADARTARDRLVEGHQRLVIHIASRLAQGCRSLDFMDLVQEGSIGLVQA